MQCYSQPANQYIFNPVTVQCGKEAEVEHGVDWRCCAGTYLPQESFNPTAKLNTGFPAR